MLNNLGTKILVADDEADVVEVIELAFALHRPNYTVIRAYDGAQVLSMISSEKPDLLILDINMPKYNGFELTRRLRMEGSLPIILLTARGSESDKVRGLELGADDYVIKPFGHKELIARVEAVLRRSGNDGLRPEPQEVTRGDLKIDFMAHRVTKGEQPIQLTPVEFRLLSHLALNAGRVIPRRMLLAKVWGPEYRDEVHYLKVYVSRLRAKLGEDPENPQYLITERGVGYSFRAD